MNNKIFSLFFAAFLAYWIVIISSVRIFDMTFNDKLSLLGKMPICYTFALFALATLSMLSFYLKKSFWSVAFAGLFALYFWLTPWFVEPLRNIDTFYHFSRVSVVMHEGTIPHMAYGSYFEYPGSTLWGAMFLSVTGMETLAFVKYFFPLLSTAIIYLGFFCVVKRITGSSLSAGPSLLFLSMFGYGGYHFSPIGFAWMIIPVLLFSIMRFGRVSFLVCFVLLTTTLAISHPTTSAFFLLVFSILVLFSLVWARKSFSITRELRLLRSRSLTFVCIILTWSSFVATILLRRGGGFAQSLFETLFSQGHEIPQKLWQAPFPILEISFARRLFVVLAGVFAVMIFFYGLLIFVRNKERENSDHKVWILLLISVILIGLSLFPLFLISIPVFGAYYLFSFGLFGAAMGFGLLKVESGFLKNLILFSFVLLLIVPSFMEAYPVEQYYILRDSIKYGMTFTGQHVRVQTGTTIVSPFSTQLYSFIGFYQWHSIEMLSKDTARARAQVEEMADYFIYRSDWTYYVSLIIERVPPEKTQYFQFSTVLPKNGSFDLIYSSREYLIFAKQKK